MSDAPPDLPVPPREPPPAVRVRRGMLSRVDRRVRAQAELAFPAVPSLVGHFVDILADHFATLGRQFSAAEIDHMRALLLGKLREAFEASPTSGVIVRYNTSEDSSLRIDYAIAASTSDLAEQYKRWVATREPPLFGALPDARIMTEARAHVAPGSKARALDIGAGTGRNSLPLARLGLDVTAVEPAPALADVLESTAANESLPVRVLRADASSFEVEAGVFDLAIASQVTSHFRSPAELRGLFTRFAAALREGGRAVVNAFVTAPDYHPDAAAREVAQVCWCAFFTPEEVATALDGLPLSTIDDQDALAYERAHCDAKDWPPTGWFEGWARGEDLFGPLPTPVLSLRWIVLERRPGGT